MEAIQIKNAALMGTISVPPSKSVTHRLLIINALSKKSAALKYPLVSEDTVITASGLTQLGYQIKMNKANAIFDGWNVNTEEQVAINVKNSGTSA